MPPTDSSKMPPTDSNKMPPTDSNKMPSTSSKKRPPTSSNPLPLDLLVNILEIVNEESPRTTRSTARVSKAFNVAAELTGHRYKTVLYGTANAQALPEDWLNDKYVLTGARHIVVKWESRGNRPVWGCDFEPLAAFIRKLSNLRSLTWDSPCPVPLSVLHAVHAHPKALLAIHRLVRPALDLDHNDEAEIALAKSPALASLQATIHSHRLESEKYDLREAAVRRLIASAPNLKQVAIENYEEARDGYDRTGEEMDTRDDRMEEFYRHLRPSSSVEWLSLNGYHFDRETLSDWGRFIDLSLLKHFECQRWPSWIESYPWALTQLRNLKSLSLHIGSGLPGGDDVRATEETSSFLTGFSPLEALSLRNWRWTLDLPVILDRHGPTLRSLQLHQEEDRSKRERTTLSLAQVELIKKSCPNLQHLTMDINRKSRELSVEDDRAMFNLLATMRLGRLQLYYDLGLNYLFIFDFPHIEKGLEMTKDTMFPPSSSKQIKSYVAKVWKIVFGARNSTHPRLLDVKFGEWESKPEVFRPMDHIVHGEKLRSFWKVRPHERYERRRECTVSYSYGEGAPSSRPPSPEPKDPWPQIRARKMRRIQEG